MRLLLSSLAVFSLASAGCTAPGSTDVHGTSAASCANCHADHAAEHSLSSHARSDSSPVFEALLPHVESSWGATARNACVDCHAPTHAVDGIDDNITCVSCHAAVGNRGERDGRLVVDVEAPLSGPLGNTTSPHATRQRSLLASDSLCGTCHEVTGPGLFDEPTLSEHRDSELRLACVDCHAPTRSAMAWVEGGEPRQRRDHRFIGFDPPWGASAAEAEAAAEQTRQLLADALALSIEEREGQFFVSLENVGASHDVPTGVKFLRDIWVDVELISSDGTTQTNERMLWLGATMMRAEEEVSLPTDADRVVEHALAFGERIEAPIPFGDATDTEIRATLRGRAIRSDVLDAIGRTDLSSEIPVHDIATATR